MRYAIVSDIHSNRQAWKAVLADIRNSGADSILCLGDVIGYGPSPIEVMDSVYEHTDDFVLGNHDAVLAGRLDPCFFNEEARTLIEWTQDRLSDEAADFFADVPSVLEGDNFLLAHGEGAWPERFRYIDTAEESRETFMLCREHVIFVGHTHLPKYFAYDFRYHTIALCPPTDFVAQHTHRYLVNVGSVGDPRDGDMRACYCLYDADEGNIYYRRVPFDVQAYREDLHRAQLSYKPFFVMIQDATQPSETFAARAMNAVGDPAPRDDGVVQKVGSRKDRPTDSRDFNAANESLTETGMRRAPARAKRSSAHNKRVGSNTRNRRLGTGPYRRADGPGSTGPYRRADGPGSTGPYRRADGPGSTGPYRRADGPGSTGPYRRADYGQTGNYPRDVFANTGNYPRQRRPGKSRGSGQTLLLLACAAVSVLAIIVALALSASKNEEPKRPNTTIVLKPGTPKFASNGQKTTDTLKTPAHRTTPTNNPAGPETHTSFSELPGGTWRIELGEGVRHDLTVNADNTVSSSAYGNGTVEDLGHGRFLITFTTKAEIYTPKNMRSMTVKHWSNPSHYYSRRSPNDEGSATRQ